MLIDDTPQAVVLSGFDPVRRELARQTLERLILDGRINPARIEDEVARGKEELSGLIHKAGEDAVFRVGLQKVHPEVMKPSRAPQGPAQLRAKCAGPLD